MSRRLQFILLTASTLAIIITFFSLHHRRAATIRYQREADLAQKEAASASDITPIPVEQKVPSGNFTVALQKLGLSTSEASSVSAAAQRAFNLRQIRAGNLISVARSVQGALREIVYRIDPDRVLKIVPHENSYSAEVDAVPSTMEVSVVSGRIDDSLFNAVAQAGESPELTMRLAQIFGYDLDFYTDPRRGDTFRVVLEKKKYAGGQPAAYGKIIAAEYDNGGKQYQALLFHDPLNQLAYYTADGKSLQKQFLRSPLKFAAPVTSHFSKARFHPILKTYRAHLGTDYGAPIGTPVQAIGAGKVSFAGRKGGEGNMVDILHSSGYETMYLHLARIYVRAGEHVAIGKIIGVVGSTGLSTGPHLDFRILQKGQYKNFEKLGLPPSDPVAQKIGRSSPPSVKNGCPLCRIRNYSKPTQPLPARAPPQHRRPQLQPLSAKSVAQEFRRVKMRDHHPDKTTELPPHMMLKILKALGVVVLLVLVLAVIGISATIGWRPFLGPKSRPLTDRKFDRTQERLQRGTYLAEHVAGCIDCHSPVKDGPTGPEMADRSKWGSGQIFNILGFPGRLVAPNITSDPETGVGNFTDDQLARAIREGISHDGKTLFPMMPYSHFKDLSDEDLASIIVYVRALPPIKSSLPPTAVNFPVKYLVRTVPEPVTHPVQADLSTP
ncbi:MAG TPA: peptidoglycan DD-metalloendopeptidase family protein, partial [Candidatus Acidoferrum sp.]